MKGMSDVISQDIAAIARRMQDELRDIQGSSWVISGGAGFLGAYFLDLIHHCNENLWTTPCKVLVMENFRSGVPQRIKHLGKSRFIRIVQADITQPFIVKGEVDYIVHAASIASPYFYRRYPLETIEANVLGLRNMLELAREKRPKSVLSFSSSEVYGDPPPEHIPTPEDYNGNVSCTGPRACYDESKRLGETLAVSYYRQWDVPVKIVRPFNIYGPGLRLEDRRVLPDFYKSALEEGEIKIFSDGSPTRSFCYVGDAMLGFLKVLLSDYDGEAFNIGNDGEEISMLALAKVVAEVVGGVSVQFHCSEDEEYLIDNPQRRRPDLTKSRSLLKFIPEVKLREGLTRALAWYREAYGYGGGG